MRAANKLDVERGTCHLRVLPGGLDSAGAPQPSCPYTWRVERDPARVGAIAHGAVLCGAAESALKLLDAGSVQTVVTSPPYWSLRDYGVAGQTGSADTLDDYIKSVVAVFAELCRVLRDDGTVWLNVGDAYTSGNRPARAPDKKNPRRAMAVRPPTPVGLKDKELVGIPWRLAFALQAAGWWVRSAITWHKPNAYPESVMDRPTGAYEIVFLLAKSADYYYDVDAVRGPNGRRLRNVWDIPTEPRRRAGSEDDDHPATMPSALAKRCIMLTSRPGDLVLDPYVGSGTTLLATADLDRRWVGIDINPDFVALAMRRMDARG